MYSIYDMPEDIVYGGNAYLKHQLMYLENKAVGSYANTLNKNKLLIESINVIDTHG